MQYGEYVKLTRRFLQQASDLRGAPGVPVNVDLWWGDEANRKLRHVCSQGIDAELPWMAFDETRRGHYMYVGMELFRWEVAQPPLPVVRVSVPPLPRFDDFWVVRETDFLRFYRCCRKSQRGRRPAPAPIMEPAMRQRLWDNTIGVLTRGREVLEHYGVAMKRGLLLMGLPGNGKTMACRWLAVQCRRRGLDWRNVSGMEFDQACRPREVRALFRLKRPGIVMFDDFDRALQDRKKFGENRTHNTFLTELDGFRPKQGVVYLFATNRQLDELDPAIRRPGRIDAVFEFTKPSPALRSELVQRHWQPEIHSAIGIERIVDDTEGLSFAELEELRTQLVFHFLDHRQWNWEVATRRLQQRTDVTSVSVPIGFGWSGAAQPTIS